MKTVFSIAKRCLALVLALLLMVPAMSIAFASTQESMTVSELLLNNYADLTEAEKEFLSHGLLADTTFTYEVPVNEDELITVDKDAKTITVDIPTSAAGKWTTVKAEIVVNEEVKETVELTVSGSKATGTYTYAGNAFAVKAYLELSAQDKYVAQMESLLDAMADLRAGYDALLGLYAENGNIELFEDAMTQEGGLVDAANNGISTGITSNAQFATIALSEEAKTVILALDAQMTANGGRVDLGALLDGYAAGAATDYLLNGDIDGLLSATEALVANLDVIHTEMSNAIGSLNGFINLASMLGLTQDDVDKLTACRDNVQMLISAINLLMSNLTAATDTAAIPGWNVDLTGKLAADVDYAHLDEHVIALGEGYSTGVAITGNEFIASATVQHNMSMWNVTVNVLLYTVDQSNKTTLRDTETVVLTLMANASASEVEAAINAAHIVENATAAWTEEGLYVDGQFCTTEAFELPETLTEDIVLEYIIDPIKYDIVGADLVGVESRLPYGYVITLPTHSDITKAYDYKVNGVSYAQGSQIIVAEPLTIERSEGRAYTNYSLFQLIADQYGNGEYELLSVRALTVKDQNVAVREPTSNDGLIVINGTTVTAGTYASDYYGLLWQPVSVDVYYEDAIVEHLTMTANSADITVDHFDYVKVNYELALTNISYAEIVYPLNLAIDLKNEAAAQRECMSILADQLANLKKLDNTVLGVVKNSASLQTTKDAVDDLRNTHFNAATGQLYLADYLDNYAANGLQYYYLDGNWAKFQAEVDALLPVMDLLLADPGILEILTGSYASYMNTIEELRNGLAEAEFTGPNEVINLRSSYLKEFTDTLDSWIPAQNTHYDPNDLEGHLTLTTSLTKTSDKWVQVLVNVAVNDKFGVSTSGTYGPLLFNSEVILDDPSKQEILAGVEAVLDGIAPSWRYDSIYAFGVEGSDLETELMAALSGELTGDLVLYYNWNEICYHFNYIAATCTELALCEDCGQRFGELDPNNHDWQFDSVHTEPGCETVGYELYVCSWCHSEELREVPATGHSWGDVWRSHYSGDHYRICQNGCGAEEHAAHEWEDGFVNKPATCTEAGEMVYVCGVCQQGRTEEIPATGHSFTNYVSNGDATCLADGTKTAACDNGCGTTATVTDAGTKLPHDFSGDVVDCGEYGHMYGCVNGECGKYGYNGVEGAYEAHNYEGTDCEEVDHCTVCNHEKAAGEHVWGPWTDNGDGTHTRVCTACGEGTESGEHTWNNGVVTTEPTCEEKGEMTYTCTLCGATKTEEIDPTDHSYGQWTSDGDETHSRECAACGDVETEDHVWTDWTHDDDETHSRTCTVCGETQKVEHVWDDGVETKPATCITPGEILITCTVCNHQVTSEIPATGKHVFDENSLWVDCGEEGHARQCSGDESCTAIEETRQPHVYEGTNCDEVDYCTVCDHEKAAGSHAWGEWTDNGDGTHTRTCTIAGCDGVETKAHTYGDWTALNDNQHTRTCSDCGAVETVAHNYGEPEVKDSTVTELGEKTYTCPDCDHQKKEQIDYKVPAGGSSTKFTMVGGLPEVSATLNGDGGSPRYYLLYTITLPKPVASASMAALPQAQSDDQYVITRVVDTALADSVNVTQYLIENHLSDFGGDERALKNHVFDAFNAGLLKIDCNAIDTYSDKLNDFVKALDAAGNGALDFSLLSSNGSFSIVANLTAPGGASGVLMNVVTSFVEDGYGYIAVETVDGFVPLLDEGQLSLQALIDGLLFQNGFGTNTLIELSKGSAAPIPGTVMVDGGQIGGLLQKISMKIGNDASNIQYTVDFYLTMSDMAQLDKIASALESVKNYVTAETKDGVMTVELTLPEKVYEVYLTLMLATGEVDKSDVDAIESAIAFRFLYDYLELILNTDADAETFENTLALLGQNYDLSSYEKYYNTLKELMLGGTTDVMGGDVVVNLDLNKDEGKGTVELVANAKTLLDALLSRANITGVESLLGSVIKEYNGESGEGDDLTISLKAQLSNEKPEFEVVVIDIRNSSVLNKADYATDGAARINALSGAAAVMLLDDITGDLVFNATTILDLNGKTITGNITANGSLIIVDSSLDTAKCGGVTGNITGSVTIIAGKYTTDVSAYLTKGYAQGEDGVVANALYTITVADNGDVTFNINSDVMDDVAGGYIPAVRSLAIDIAVDLVLNYFTAAALEVDGNKLYAVDTPDFVELFKREGGKVENVIDELLGYIKVDTGVTAFVNDLVEDLLNFGAIADGIEKDTPVATYSVTTNPWQIAVGHNVTEDYISFGITNNASLAKSFNLSLVITGSNAKTHLLPLMEELAEVVKDQKPVVNIQLYQPLYDNKTLHNVGGTVSVDIRLDMTGEYPIALAIILAANGVDMGSDLQAVLTAYNRSLDPSCSVLLKGKLDTVTAGQVVAALKAMNRSTDFYAMARKAGINTDELDVKAAASLEKAYHLILCGVGKVLEYLDITGTNQTLGSLENGTNTGVYTADKENINRSGSYTHSSGYGIAYHMTAKKVSVTMKLFNTCEHTFGTEWKSDDANHWHECVCGEKADVAEHTLVYVNNGDGTHDYCCEICGYISIDDEAHTYVDGYCVCGAEEPNDPYVPPYIPPVVGHCPGCGKNVCHSESFSDLNLNAWYHEYTDYVLCKGLMIGMGGDVFAPEFTTNRAMLVTTLYRFAGSPAVDCEMPYEDVLEGQWYSDAVIWATENNIVEGYGNGCFGPFDTLTREQSATIFHRYAKLLGLDVSGSDDVLAGYQDADQVSDWAVDGVKWAVTSGMMNGRSTTAQILCPKDGIKRDEIAALLYRWCEEIND